MKRYLLAALVLAIAFSSCRHKKEVVQATTVASSDVKADSLNKTDNYRFIISFYSIGSGRDVVAYQKFNAYMADYQKQKNLTIATEETPWGREGEVDYCMGLTELAEIEQREFITNLKSALTDAKWVHYFENAPCRNKRR